MGVACGRTGLSGSEYAKSLRAAPFRSSGRDSLRSFLEPAETMDSPAWPDEVLEHLRRPRVR